MRKMPQTRFAQTVCHFSHNADFDQLRISKYPANAHEINYFSMLVVGSFKYTLSESGKSSAGKPKGKEKMMNTKTEGNTFTKKIGQTVYVVRYHFNEDAKETCRRKSTECWLRKQAEWQCIKIRWM